MPSKRYPPLKPSEVIKILKKHGFKYKDTEGSHEKYEGFIKNKRRVVTIDLNEKDFGVPLMKSMINQSGLSRRQFYETIKKKEKRFNNS